MEGLMRESHGCKGQSESADIRCTERMAELVDKREKVDNTNQVTGRGQECYNEKGQR